MRALSLRQAQRCENAVHPKCRCRCGGAFHGSARVKAGGLDERQAFEQLPEDDPHHLPDAEERKARKKGARK